MYSHFVSYLGFFSEEDQLHNGATLYVADGVSNHQPHDCLPKRFFRRRSKKTSKLRVTGLCAGNSPVTGEFPAQRASDAENVSIWWRHHEPFEKCLIHYPYSLSGHPFFSCRFVDNPHFFKIAMEVAWGRLAFSVLNLLQSASQ